MPRVLKFRPLCDQCERAEASVWCLGESAALCTPCDATVHAQRRAQRHRRVPIAASSVVSALCARCATAPAATFHVDHSLALCELCACEVNPPSAPRPPRGVMPLRDSHVAGSIVFDKMDFSSVQGAKVAWRGQSGCGSAGATTSNSARMPGAPSNRPSTGQGSGRKRTGSAAASNPAWLGDQNDTHSRTSTTPQIDLSYFKTKVPPSVARARSKKGTRSAVKANDDTLARVAGGRAAKGHSGGRKEKK